MIRFEPEFLSCKKINSILILFQVVPLLGVRTNYDNNRFVNELKIKPTNLKDSLIDMAYSLIEREIILKKQTNTYISNCQFVFVKYYYKHSKI